MDSVAEIKQAIASLPRREFVRLERWFDSKRKLRWDREIEEDAKNGRLRGLYEQIQFENQGRPSIALGEFLRRKSTLKTVSTFGKS